jgi:hypothetical protein
MKYQHIGCCAYWKSNTYWRWRITTPLCQLRYHVVNTRLKDAQNDALNVAKSFNIHIVETQTATDTKYSNADNNWVDTRDAMEERIRNPTPNQSHDLTAPIFFDDTE